MPVPPSHCAATLRSRAVSSIAYRRAAPRARTGDRCAAAIGSDGSTTASDRISLGSIAASERDELRRSGMVADWYVDCGAFSAMAEGLAIAGEPSSLDLGGRTMKASRLDDAGRATSFRLNDEWTAGTGAFLVERLGDRDRCGAGDERRLR